MVIEDMAAARGPFQAVKEGERSRDKEKVNPAESIYHLFHH